MIAIVVSGAVLVVVAAVRAARAASRRTAVAGRLAREDAAAAPAAGMRLALPAPPSWLPARLATVGVEVDPRNVWAGWMGAALVSTAGGFAMGGPTLAFLAGAAAAVAPVAVWPALRGRGRALYEAAMPTALEAVARSLRSGGALRQAVAEAAAAVPGPVGADLGAVALAAGHGLPLVTGLEAWAERRPLPAVRLAVAAVCLGAETGGAQAKAVDGVAATVRDRLAVAGEVRALSSQARASALVIAAAPLVFCAFSVATDARTATFLFRTTLGQLFLVAGIGLDALAGAWMARLSRVDQ